MSRPSDWSALGWFEDPVPGSPTSVQDGATAMLQAATTISEAAVNLRRIAAMDGMVSEAVEAFRARAEEVAAEIELVHERYSQTGQALGDYVTPLAEAQEWSASALEKANDARARLATAETDVYNAANAAQYSVEDADRESALEALTAANIRLGNAQNDLETARSELLVAIDHRDAAAEATMGRLDGAMEANGLDDSRWRQFLNKNADFLNTLGKILAGIGVVLAIAALFIPGVNFLAAGLLLGLGSAGINFALAENGNKGWGDFAFDVFGLATLGVGKVLTSVVRLGRGANAARAASGRASQLRGRRPSYPRRGGGPNGDSKRLRRQRRQRKGEMRDRWVQRGRDAQRREYTQNTTAPDVSPWNARSMVDGARDNIRRNGIMNVLKAGGGDAYQMSYYARIRHLGGGDAASAVYRSDVAAGVISYGENAGSIATFVLDGDKSEIGRWAGDLVDPHLPDQPRQDDVTSTRPESTAVR